MQAALMSGWYCERRRPAGWVAEVHPAPPYGLATSRDEVLCKGSEGKFRVRHVHPVPPGFVGSLTELQRHYWPPDEAP